MIMTKKILYISYIIYIIVSFGFILFTDSLFDQVGIQNTIDFLKYWSAFGLFLFLIEIVSENVFLKKRQNEIKRLKKENETLKAKIYDIEEKDREIDSSINAFEKSLKSKERTPDQKKKF